MFTRKDRLKELAEYFGACPDAVVTAVFNDKYPDHAKKYGIARRKTYTYTVPGLEIVYDKWFVDGYDCAIKMGLEGCEYHDCLVAGTGVMVVSKKFGREIFYGKSAQELINACENKIIQNQR